MDKEYTNYISLGYFCEVAGDLEKLGLRNFSSPFDWGISYFPDVLRAIETRFEGFMDYDNLSQGTFNRNFYHEDRYNFYFFHDFTKYKSLEKQYKEVKEKYARRILRFLTAIKLPTLFVRYISVEELDETGKSVELLWIEKNYEYILTVLRRYNVNNDIVFIGDETVISDIVKIYHVKRGENDWVSRSPICSKKELYSLLNSVIFPNKKINIERYKRKDRDKRSYLNRFLRKINCLYRETFFKAYEHKKTYYIEGK